MLRNDPSILTDHDVVGIGLDLRTPDGAGCDRVLVVVEAHQAGLRDRRRRSRRTPAPASRVATNRVIAAGITQAAKLFEQPAAVPVLPCSRLLQATGQARNSTAPSSGAVASRVRTGTPLLENV